MTGWTVRSTSPSRSSRRRVCESIFSLTPTTLRRKSLNRRVPSRSATSTSIPQRLVTSFKMVREGHRTAKISPRLIFDDGVPELVAAMVLTFWYVLTKSNFNGYPFARPLIQEQQSRRRRPGFPVEPERGKENPYDRCYRSHRT